MKIHNMPLCFFIFKDTIKNSNQSFAEDCLHSNLLLAVSHHYEATLSHPKLTKLTFEYFSFLIKNDSGFYSFSKKNTNSKVSTTYNSKAINTRTF